MKKYAASFVAAAALAATVPFGSFGSASAATSGGFFPVGGSIPTVPVTHVIVTPPPVQTPVTTTPQTPVQSVTAPIVGPSQFFGVQPKDITNLNYLLVTQPKGDGQPIISGGIKTIDPNLFPKKPSDGNPEYILVRGDANSQFVKTSPTSVKLTDGTILVSVRRPSNYAIIQTPDGEIALNSDGDLLISYVGSILRVDNISSRGIRCKIKINGNILEGHSQVVALAPGYEMVAGDHELLRGDVRVPDGIARRGMQLLANGHLAVAEFSVDSMLATSAIVVAMNNEANNREHKVLNDMCKMAAVLNVVNGPDGYRAAGKTGLAEQPGAGTQ